jgi:tRNA(Ile)-lysidine synthase
MDVQIFKRPATIKTTEKALRERRYQCFTSSFMKGKKEEFLMLGHHLEDRIESTFLNTIRGAGLKGFLNMQTLQSHPLVPNMQVGRPLLRITKPHLIAFCKQFNILFFEDATNTDMMISQRNLIRHEIIEKLV